LDATTLDEDLRSGGRNMIQCSLVNVYILERYAEPSMCNPLFKGRKKWDFFSFRLDVTEQLIGAHKLRKKKGC